MAEQGAKKETNNPGTDDACAKRWRGPAAFAVVVGLCGLVLTLFASCRRAEVSPASSGARKADTHSARSTPAPRLSEQALKDTAWDTAWPPLPDAGTPAQPLEQVRAMYAFAARHPEVLQYAPCYCGCESGGHMNARDCFVKGRDARGNPQWDGMGFT